MQSCLTCGDSVTQTSMPTLVLPNGEANKAWFAEQVNSRYQDPNGYPWTRLGYTFDWNPETPRYGASEYVIRKGSAVTVKTRTSTAEYCR